MLRKLMFALVVMAVGSSGALAQNAASGWAGPGVATTNFFPNHGSALDTNVYFALASSGVVGTAATDACLAGDNWQIINIGLPGPSIDIGMTDGTAEGCACAHSGGYDAGAATRVLGSLALVIGRYSSGTDVFPASWELQIIGALERQVRGTDACL
jgi:hypothetical protein